MNAKPRWQCPECKSTNVRISLPCWFTETVGANDNLHTPEPDYDADVLWWYCGDCDETGSGQPEETEDAR